MGYSTDFEGQFKLDKAPTQAQIEFIQAFSRTRRMKRNPHKLYEIHGGENGLPFNFKPSDKLEREMKALEDEYNVEIKASSTKDTRNPIEIYGSQGEFFAEKDAANFGQNEDPSIVDYNGSGAAPGLWCGWEIGADGKTIQWDGGEKFYSYVEWLNFIINNFLTPWGIKISGSVTWEGEDSSDVGKIVIENQTAVAKRGRIVYED